MKLISLKGEPLTSEMSDEAAEVLERAGLVCLPCGGTYRIVADLGSYEAVMRLFHSKRRTRDAPTLVFVSDETMLESIAADIEPLTQRLIDELWPGALTILIEPDLDLPRKMVKRMCKRRGKIGVRVPASQIARGVVRAFGRPLLVSSANIEKKKGAYSSAQVRKNFGNSVDLFFDVGDLGPAPSSTVVNVDDGSVDVVRQGAITDDEVRRAAGT